MFRNDSIDDLRTSVVSHGQGQMERWTDWRDAGTGIQPFLPLPKRSIGFPLAAVQIILSILKFPLVLLLVAVCLILSALTFNLRVANRIVCAPLLRLIMILLGCVWIEAGWSTLRLGRPVQSKTSNRVKCGSNIRAGDLIVCNHASYLDILYLAFRFSPVFAWPLLGNDGIQFEPITWYTAIYRLACFPIATANSGRSLKAIQQKANGPVVYFPELTTSNGRGLLKPLESKFPEAELKQNKLHVIAFKYQQTSNYPATFTFGSLLSHAFMLSGQIKGVVMNVLYLYPEETPSLQDDSDEKLQDDLMDALSKLLRCRRTNMTVRDKQAFIKAFNSKRK